MRLAYADPPYLGWCSKYGHEHNDDGDQPWDGKCWNDPDTHRLLLEHLAASYDGWAYSMSSPSLHDLLAFAPTARVAAWVKPFAAFRRDIRVAYAWEPVLFSPGRDSTADGAPMSRDFLAERITMQRGFTGTKPERFCRWMLDLLGYVDGDELTDLFRGHGPMERALANDVLH